MSGRLIILPKKSYCPWNPKNVERVLRDERRYMEEQQRKDQDERNALSQSRMDTLKAAKKSSHRDSLSSAAVEEEQLKSQHVNLFAMEEEAATQALLGKCKTNQVSKDDKCGIMPVYLGQSVRNQAVPFYLRQGDATTTETINSRERRVRAKEDPMLMFQSNERQQPEDSNDDRKIKSRKNYDATSSPGNKNSHSIAVRPSQRTNQQVGFDSIDTDSSSDGREVREKRRKHRKRYSRKKSKRRHYRDPSSEDDDSSDAESRTARDDSSSFSSTSSSCSSDVRRRRRKRRRKHQTGSKTRDHVRSRERKHGRGNRRRKYSSRRRNHDGERKNEIKKDADVDTSMEELRRRRAEREEKERQRQQAVIQDNNERRHDGRYFNQYNPALSRL